MLLILLHSFVNNQSQSVEENGQKEVGTRSFTLKHRTEWKGRMTGMRDYCLHCILVKYIMKLNNNTVKLFT